MLRALKYNQSVANLSSNTCVGKASFDYFFLPVNVAQIDHHFP